MRRNLFSCFFLLLSFVTTSCGFSAKKGNTNSFSFEESDDTFSTYDVVEEDVELERIYFKKPHIQTIIGSTTKLELGFEPYTAATSDIKYSISDPYYGTVSDDGILTTTKKGSFKVYAYGPNDVSAVCSIDSGSGAVEEIQVPVSIELTIGDKDEEKLSYSAYPEDAFQDLKVINNNSDVVSIVNNKVVASQAGNSIITVFDDANHNNRCDESEKTANVSVRVHDFRNVTNEIMPTTTSEGRITRTCLCGCGETKNQRIPSNGHNLAIEETIIQPDCTHAGVIRKKCVDKNCNYTIEEEIAPLGHSATIKEVSEKNMARLGDYMNKTQYYLKCDRCHQFTNQTFGHGHHDEYYTTGMDNYFGDKTKADNYRAGYRNTINAFENYKDKSFGSTFNVGHSSKLGLSSGKCITLVQMAASDRGTYPWVHSNKSNWSLTYSGGSATGIRVSSSSGYNDVNKRKADMVYLDKIYAEVDALIRPGATDAEKALIICIYTAKYISYKKTWLFFDTITKGQGVCLNYAYMVCLLAHRYNLACVLNVGNQHAWNNICIDGTWYLFDTTWSDCNLAYLFREKGPSSVHRINAPTVLVKDSTKSIKTSLIQLYKNGELNGIYYDLNTCLGQVNDSKADYKVVLGIGRSGIQGMTISGTYHLKEYTTTLPYCNYKTLKIEKCKGGSSISLNAPGSFFNQKNLELDDIKKVQI